MFNPNHTAPPGRLQLQIGGDSRVGKTILLAWLGTWLERMLQDCDQNVPIRVVNRNGDWPKAMRQAMDESTRSFDLGGLTEIVLVDYDAPFSNTPDAFRGGYQGPLHPVEADESDANLTPEELASKYSEIEQHPRYPRKEWKEQVTDDLTTSGYWEWVSHQLNNE